MHTLLNAVLLRHYNFTAAGFATAVTEVLFLVGAMIAFQAVTGRSALTLSALPYLLPAAVMVAILHFTAGGAVLRVSVGTVLGLASIAAILVSPQARRFREEMARSSSLLSPAAGAVSSQGEM